MSLMEIELTVFVNNILCCYQYLLIMVMVIKPCHRPSKEAYLQWARISMQRL
jgi:hypothetical protein